MSAFQRTSTNSKNAMLFISCAKLIPYVFLFRQLLQFVRSPAQGANNEEITHKKKRQFVKYAIIQLQCQEIKSDPFRTGLSTRAFQKERETPCLPIIQKSANKKLYCRNPTGFFFTFYGLYGVFFSYEKSFYILYKSCIQYLQKILSSSASCLCKRAHRILILDYVMPERGSTWEEWCFHVLSSYSPRKEYDLCLGR